MLWRQTLALCASDQVIQCWHLISALNAWAARASYTTARPINSYFLGIVAWMNSQMHVPWIRKLRGSFMYLAYFIDMLSVGVCTTKHWQTSSRLVQELSVCTVLSSYLHITKTSGFVKDKPLKRFACCMKSLFSSLAELMSIPKAVLAITSIV